MATAWDPDRYRRFVAERSAPFHDLLDMVRSGPTERVADLGCGPGELTALAAQPLGASTVVGVDNSSEMLAAAAEHARACSPTGPRARPHPRTVSGDGRERKSAASVNQKRSSNVVLR